MVIRIMIWNKLVSYTAIFIITTRDIVVAMKSFVSLTAMEVQYLETSLLFLTMRLNFCDLWMSNVLLWWCQERHLFPVTYPCCLVPLHPPTSSPVFRLPEQISSFMNVLFVSYEISKICNFTRQFDTFSETITRPVVLSTSHPLTPHTPYQNIKSPFVSPGSFTMISI